MIYSRLQESLIFSRLPDDVTEKRKFSKLFKELNKFLESARVQGFVWEKRDYEFEDDNGNKDIVTLLFDENIYNILLRRYKELRTGGSGGSDDEPYDIEPYLMSLSTDKIDAEYMNSRFRKYIKMMGDGTDEQTRNVMLNELHKSFANLSQDQQKYANILLKDIQNAELVIDDDKTILDYITEYQSRAKSDQFCNFARNLGINETALKQIMSLHETEDDINAYGRYDKHVEQVNID